MIGLITVVILIVTVIAMAIWSTQIRLTAPVNIAVGEVDMHTVQISWDEVEHATSYGVLVYEVNGAEPIRCEHSEMIEVEITGLCANQCYDVAVIAYYDKEEKHIESEPSEKINLQTLSPKLGQIESIQATAIGSESIVVQWTPYQTEDVNADGMGGIADYGECPFATGEPYIDENGVIYFAP